MTDIPLLRAPVHLSLPFYVCSCLQSLPIYSLSAPVYTLNLSTHSLLLSLLCLYMPSLSLTIYTVSIKILELLRKAPNIFLKTWVIKINIMHSVSLASPYSLLSFFKEQIFTSLLLKSAHVLGIL